MSGRCHRGRISRIAIAWTYGRGACASGGIRPAIDWSGSAIAGAASLGACTHARSYAICAHGGIPATCGADPDASWSGTGRTSRSCCSTRRSGTATGPSATAGTGLSITAGRKSAYAHGQDARRQEYW